jgi:hypothetical protein
MQTCHEWPSKKKFLLASPNIPLILNSGKMKFKNTELSPDHKHKITWNLIAEY